MGRFEFIAQQPLHAANLNQELGRTVQYRGAWTEGEQYVANDLVLHTQAHWLALANSIGSEPVEGSDNWELLSGGDTNRADRTLSNLTDASAARSHLGLGEAATKNVGTASGTVAAGNDARFPREAVIFLDSDTTEYSLTSTERGANSWVFSAPVEGLDAPVTIFTSGADGERSVANTTDESLTFKTDEDDAGIVFAAGERGRVLCLPNKVVKFVRSDDAQFHRIELENQGTAVADNSGYVLEAIQDPLNSNTTALRMRSRDSAGHRFYFGANDLKFYCLDFSGVGFIEHFPVLDLGTNYLQWGADSISMRRSGIDLEYNTRYDVGTHLFYTSDGLIAKIANLGLAVKTSSPHSTLHATGSLALGANTARTSATTLTSAHYALFYDTSSAGITQNLPDASGLDGREYACFKATSDANTLAVAPPGGQGTSTTLTTLGGCVVYRAFNGKWWRVSVLD